MQLYAHSLSEYTRLQTREVKVGNLVIGNGNPIRIQTMTTTDTMDTIATVNQAIRCILAGAELVRITAPSKTEAENLLNIKNELHQRGYHVPLVADIHFTPNAAEIAARIVEKVRVNPGNYVDKKKFELLEYTDLEYVEETERIRARFSPLVKICKTYGTAMRIGTNHGSLSDRIMSRYGDTPMGMVESAMEFLRIARDESYHQIILSMKSSNPLVMVQAYRLLVEKMTEEFGECYPLHLGVTEAGDGEDGRIKSAIGIGTLLEDGIGDTIRVSLTEDPEFEIPVCKDIVNRYTNRTSIPSPPGRGKGWVNGTTSFNPYQYSRRSTDQVSNIGSKNVPVVVADFKDFETVTREDLQAIGYVYNPVIDKWHIGDGAADYTYTGAKLIDFPLPGTLKVICDHAQWLQANDKDAAYPLFQGSEFMEAGEHSAVMNFVGVDVDGQDIETLLAATREDQSVIFCAWSSGTNVMSSVRRFIMELTSRNMSHPVILAVESSLTTIDEQLIHFSTDAGALLLDGMGDGIWLRNNPALIQNNQVSGRTYLETRNNHQFLNNTSFSILQATRTRISKTEYISCPSCGRTLFDLQETTAKIRSVTNHLKGLKIAVMGCIVNGPGEMADADFGYVGSGPGKITLYKGKEVIKRSVSSEVAVEELVNLIKENNAWTEPG